MTNADPRDAIGAALAMIPSGCAILTAAAGGESTGMLASWVQQAAFDPPMVTVAVKRQRPITELIARSGRLTLNLIGDDPGPLFKHFGKGFAPGAPAFDGLGTAAGEYGIELDEAAAVLGCRVTETAEAGDHLVYIAEVVAGRRPNPGKPYVHLRKSGFSY